MNSKLMQWITLLAASGVAMADCYAGNDEGLAARHPFDKGLANDPDVIFTEDFERGSLADLDKRWNGISNRDGKVLAFSDDVGPASPGKRCLVMTSELGQNTGGHLYKLLPRQVETVYARFYVMLKCNSAPEKHDGELALWLDGTRVAHFRPGVKRGQWTGMGFNLAEQGKEVFEGFRWRTHEELKINFFWLLFYVTENAARQNRIANPDPINKAWFDDIVVATSYIGPVTK